jgi:hypothetical protein
VVVAALAGCSAKPSSTPPPPPKGGNLTIEVALERNNKNKCVVRIQNPNLKDAQNAKVDTAHTLTWKVVGNDCGEKTKISKKALGLKSMKLKGTTDSAFWLKDCSDLPRVPVGGGVEFHCPIPTSTNPDWHWKGDYQTYEYEIDGDEVEPGDPDVGIRRNG